MQYAAIDAILLDMDGVLVEVADSYRSAIVETAKSFGKSVSMEDIDAAKARGGANNDWVLTRRLILGDAIASNATSSPTLDDVTKEFERLYQGTPGSPGLKELEQPLVPQALLKSLMNRTSGLVCVVTGRPRKDCFEAMERFGWDKIIPSDHCVCMEDGPPKPDPFPIVKAMEILEAKAGKSINPARCLMLGDTVDDVLAAIAAGVRAIGVLTPSAAYSKPQAAAASGAGASDASSVSPLPAETILRRAGAEEILLPGLAGLPALADASTGKAGAAGRLFGSEGGGDTEAALQELLGHRPSGGGAEEGVASIGVSVGVFGGPTGDPDRAMAALRVRAKAIASVPPSAPAWVAAMAGGAREGACSRQTKETSISAWVRLDGTGWSAVSTGIGFLDHMVGALAKHGRMDVKLLCRGDLWIDDHHTAEDCALALGEAMDRALGARKDITRWGSAMCPLDEALARAVVDVSSRPFALVNMHLKRDSVGAISCEMLVHVLESLLTAARLTAHVDVLRGDNDHHKAEASFKAVGVALRTAFRRDEGAGVPSTKGVLA